MNEQEMLTLWDSITRPQQITAVSSIAVCLDKDGRGSASVREFVLKWYTGEEVTEAIRAVEGLKKDGEGQPYYGDLDGMAAWLKEINA